MPPTPKRWQVAPKAPPSHLARLPGLHPLMTQVLYNRGITAPADIDTFLGDDDSPANPFALRDMEKAITRLREALRQDEPIAVYGDFDADGVTATVLLVQTLEALGGDVRAYIPDRIDEGYGLHKAALTSLAKEGVGLTATVDCGVRSLQEVDHANHLGMDVIITDHHSVGPELPNGVAVIDPKRPDEAYPFHELAGVGVAYRLAQALLRSHRQAPITEADLSLDEESLLDLVALGTVADMVPLLSENRALVRRGLASLNALQRPGLMALSRKAGLRPGQIDATAISYSLAPRINAAGRMGRTELAYRLLNTRRPAEAQRLADALNRLNRERQQTTRAVQDRASQAALEADDGGFLLFAAAPDFPAGIVGLVANRLLDRFYRPAVIVEIGDRYCKGSARSIDEFHITEALDRCADLLERYGGHAAAAGFTLPHDNLDELAERLNRLATEQLTGLDLSPVLNVDAETPLDQLTWELMADLAQLEPCGYANPQPLFVSRGVHVDRRRTVGSDGRHLKLSVSDSQGRRLDAIAFRQGEWLPKLPETIDLAYHFEINEWNGRRSLQLNVQDLRPSGMDDPFEAR